MYKFCTNVYVYFLQIEVFYNVHCLITSYLINGILNVNWSIILDFRFSVRKYRQSVIMKISNVCKLSVTSKNFNVLNLCKYIINFYNSVLCAFTEKTIMDLRILVVTIKFRTTCFFRHVSYLWKKLYKCNKLRN